MRTSPPRTRLGGGLTGGLAAAALVLALGACSSDDEPSAEPSDETSSADAGGGSVSPPDLPEIPRIRQAEGAVADLELGDCPTDAGEQTVEGEITNSAAEPSDVVIVISWTNDTSDVLGRGVDVAEDVPPGETQPFTITAEVGEGATQCVPNVRRGQVRG